MIAALLFVSAAIGLVSGTPKVLQIIYFFFFWGDLETEATNWDLLCCWGDRKLKLKMKLKQSCCSFVQVSRKLQIIVTSCKKKKI